MLEGPAFLSCLITASRRLELLSIADDLQSSSSGVSHASTCILLVEANDDLTLKELW